MNLSDLDNLGNLDASDLSKLEPEHHVAFLWNWYNKLASIQSKIIEVGGGRSKIEQIRNGLPHTHQVISGVDMTFRHYTGSLEISDIITQSGKLKAGATPYIWRQTIDPTTWLRETYKDTTGIFLTTPDCLPESVGLTSLAKSYIDLRLTYDFPIVSFTHFTHKEIMAILAPLGMEIPIEITDVQNFV